jgi:hypothetical protein
MLSAKAHTLCFPPLGARESTTHANTCGEHNTTHPSQRHNSRSAPDSKMKAPGCAPSPSRELPQPISHSLNKCNERQAVADCAETPHHPQHRTRAEPQLTNKQQSCVLLDSFSSKQVRMHTMRCMRTGALPCVLRAATQGTPCAHFAGRNSECTTAAGRPARSRQETQG